MRCRFSRCGLPDTPEALRRVELPNMPNLKSSLGKRALGRAERWHGTLGVVSDRLRGNIADG
eukprot:7227577-Pyramimonas_sp.AAC.1